VRRRHRRRLEAAFLRGPPFLPATVLVFILAIAAGLFAGSYTYILANPTPHRIPVAVVDAGTAVPEPDQRFLDTMDRELNGSLHPLHYDTPEAAREAVESQRVFAILDVRTAARIPVDVSGASGSSVAQVVTTAAAEASRRTGIPIAVTDINPLQPGDPRGLAIFYITLAAVIIGFVGAIQLSVHAGALTAVQRIGFTVAYALLGGFAIAALVDWWLGALTLPFVQSWGILAFTMFTSGMIFSMFSVLFGRWSPRRCSGCGGSGRPMRTTPTSRPATTNSSFLRRTVRSPAGRTRPVPRPATRACIRASDRRTALRCRLCRRSCPAASPRGGR
jgi:hypothetical protein